MSAAALQPSDQLWAEMRRAGQLFFSVGYPYHSTYLAQPERAGFMLWRNEWGQPMLNIVGPCKGKRQRAATIVEGWRQALEVIPAAALRAQPRRGVAPDARRTRPVCRAVGVPDRMARQLHAVRDRTASAP